MFKKILIYIAGILMILIIVGQLIVPFSQGKLSFFDFNREVDVEQVLNADKRAVHEILQAVIDQAGKDHISQSKVTFDYRGTKDEMTVQERTVDSNVREYLVEHSNGSSFYMNSENDKRYLSKTDQRGWVESEQTRIPMLAIHFIKFLVESDGNVEMEKINDKSIQLRKQTEDVTKILEFLSYAELPFYVEDFSVFDGASLEYLVTPEGQLTYGKVMMVYNEQIVSFEILTNRDITAISVPEVTTGLEDVEFTKSSIEFNNNRLVLYELMTSRIVNGETKPLELDWINYYEGKMDASMHAVMNDDKVENATMVDNPVDVRRNVLDFVLAEYSTLEEQERPNNEDAEDGTDADKKDSLKDLAVWRYSVENDYDAFVEKLKPYFKNVDFEQFKRESETGVMYVIDVMIDRRTHLITGVNIWSVTGEDEEIKNVITYRFGRYDMYNFNNLKRSLIPDASSLIDIPE